MRALIKVVKGPAYRFDFPTHITVDGTNVWVTDPGDQSVTGFPAT